MRRFSRSGTDGLLPLLVMTSVLLPGCPLKDDYYVENEQRGGAPSSGGSEAAGEPAVSNSGRGGVSNASGASNASGEGNAASAGDTSGGGSAAVTSSGGSAQSTAGAGGDNGTGTGGCISAENQGHEYAFCFGALIQAEARATCGDRGMTLAVIENQAEGAWIAKSFSDQYRGASPSAFIGANDVASEGEWRWADGVTFWRGGAAVSGRYANWEDGQPNDSDPTGGSEDCLTIGLADGTWNDVSCDTELPYVCEPR
jgi:hypothetical protein